MKIFTDTFVCRDESQVMSLKAGFKVTHIQIICIVYIQPLMVDAQSKHGLTSQRVDNLNTVISGAQLWQWWQKPHPFIVHNLLFLWCNQSEESWRKRRAGLRRRGAETSCLSRQTLQKKDARRRGLKSEAKVESERQRRFQKAYKSLQLSCWVYELSRSFWSEWIKRWGHLVSFSPALERFIQGYVHCLTTSDWQVISKWACGFIVSPAPRSSHLVSKQQDDDGENNLKAPKTSGWHHGNYVHLL